MNSFRDSIKGKKVLVFGLGRQGGGTGDANWLRQNGADVKLSDQDLSLVSEGQTQAQVDWAEIIIKNPGVRDDHPLIKHARARKTPVYTSMALYLQHAQIPVIGVTGTRGKTTTASLIFQLLKSHYGEDKVLLGGNIPGSSGLSLLDQEAGKSYVVLELSSFQLHALHDLQISPKIAVLTNLYPDHLNRYPNMASYQHDKEAICAYQTKQDICFFNLDNKGAKEIASCSLAKQIGFRASDVATWPTKLPGQHNRENIAAMAKLAQYLGIDSHLAQMVARDFPGVPYRMETIRELNGVTYINDTTSTTPTSAIKALASTTAPCIWITGGDTKNLPYNDLLSTVSSSPLIKHIIILGSHNIQEYVTALNLVAKDKIIAQLDNMKQAVSLAHDHAQSGDTVLLSPGFTSFDLFKNEFDRGDQFNQSVLEL